MNNNDKEYQEFLEGAIQESIDIADTQWGYHGPEEQVVSWKGQGDLPKYLADPDLASIVDKVTGKDKLDKTAQQQDTHGVTEDVETTEEEAGEKEELLEDSEAKAEEDDSPLSILEDLEEISNIEDIPEGAIEEDGTITLPEDLKFTEEEGEIITRLIGEMNNVSESLDSEDLEEIDEEAVLNELDALDEMDSAVDSFEEGSDGEDDVSLEDEVF